MAVSVLSGNRNFEGRISPDARANYLASRPRGVAYALAGTVDWDPINEPLGQDRGWQDVFLRDIWPDQEEVAGLVRAHVNQGQFVSRYSRCSPDPTSGAHQHARVRSLSMGRGFHLHPGASVLRRPRTDRRPDRAGDRSPGPRQTR